MELIPRLENAYLSGVCLCVRVCVCVKGQFRCHQHNTPLKALIGKDFEY